MRSITSVLPLTIIFVAPALAMFAAETPATFKVVELTFKQQEKKE